MVIIRLRRTGKKNDPTYRIVVTDQRKSVYSPYIDILGNYDPGTKKIVLDKVKALAWMNKGAKPTNTVSKLFEKEGIKHKLIVIKKFRAVSKEELEAQKTKEEAEKAKAQAEKEAAKAAFEEKVEAEKAAQPSSEEKLKEAAVEEIKEEKAEGAEAPETKAEETKPAESHPEKAEPETKKQAPAQEDKK